MHTLIQMSELIGVYRRHMVKITMKYIYASRYMCPPLATTWCVYRPVANGCVCVSCHGTLNAPTIEISEMCYLMVLLVNFSVDGQNSKKDATFRRMCDVEVKHVFTGPRHNENRPKK